MRRFLSPGFIILIAYSYLFLVLLSAILLPWGGAGDPSATLTGTWLEVNIQLALLGGIMMVLLALLYDQIRPIQGYPSGLSMYIGIVEFLLLAIFLVSLIHPLPFSPDLLPFTGYQLLAAWTGLILYRSFHNRDTIGSRLIRWGLIWMFTAIPALILRTFFDMNERSSNIIPFLSERFYFHALYNGFLTLSILGLILDTLSKKRDLYPERLSGILTWILNLAILLTFPLSFLDQDPSLSLYLAGGLGSATQVVIILFLLLTILREFDLFLKTGKPFVNLMLIFALASLELKLYLQFLGGIPAIHSWVSRHDILEMAYLQLLISGFILTFCTGWWYRQKPGREAILFRLGSIYFIAGFIGLEAIWSLTAFMVFKSLETPRILAFVSTASLSLGILLFTLEGWRVRIRKNGKPDHA